MDSNIYRIRIHKCDNPDLWYSKCIGNVFYAGGKTINGVTFFIIVNDKLYKGKLCSIRDASVIEQVTKVRLFV